MNCFNNNVPHLTASERTRNVKVRSIYKSTRRDYQIRGKCNDFNGKIGFYAQAGQLRNTNSYDTLFNLNRGYALCVDGAADPEEHSLYDISGQSIYRGLASCARHDKINPMRVKLVNGRNSIYNIFNGGNWDPRALFAGAHLLIGFLYGFPVIKTFPPPSGDCHTWDPLQPFAQHDGSWNILNYPLQNSDGCGVVIDPSNILFGTDFCPTDIDNRTQGANKYLTFAQTASFVLATGQLFDASGHVIRCDLSRNYIRPGMIIMGGVGGTTGDIKILGPPTGSTKHSPPTIRQAFAANFMTSWGTIERACCGTGPNNEPHWWEIYIKPSIGALIPQEKLPVTVQIPGVSDPNEVWTTIAETNGSIGGKEVEWGGVWEYGPTKLHASPSSPIPDGNLFTNFGKNPGGGGIAIFDSIAVLRAIAHGPDAKHDHGYPPIATMGWRRNNNPAKTAPWKLVLPDVEKAFVEGPEGFWIIEPYMIISGVGSCAKNLLFGNNTKQNYLVSYDPRSKNVRFNINDKILRKYSM